MKKRSAKCWAVFLSGILSVSFLLNILTVSGYALDTTQMDSASTIQQSIEQELDVALQNQDATEDNTLDEVYGVLEQSKDLAFMTEDEVNQLLEQINELQQETNTEIAQDVEDQLNNAQIAAESMQEAWEAKNNGTLDELEETGKENSWRYQNGERIDVNQPATLSSLPDDVAVLSAGKYWGIDVSHHQGTIDWQTVKNSGIDFVIIRCGYGGDYASQDDRQWEANVRACEELDIPYGVYLYSYATSVADAYSEAQHVLRLLKGHNPSLPVFLDLEENRTAVTGNDMMGQITQTFYDEVTKAGYKVGVYASLSWWQYYFTAPIFSNDNLYRWIAQWGPACTYNGRYEMWQYTETGTLPGIAGNVDMDYWYGELDLTPDLPTGYTGLAEVPDTTTWAYYKNGVIDTTYTGMAENIYGWWYVRNGYVDTTYSGLAQNQYGTWVFRNGQIDWNANGIVQAGSTWCYAKGGKLETSFSGMAQGGGIWRYVRNGYVDFAYTGMAENQYGWWYMSNGSVNFGYTGFAQNQYGTWVFRNGQIDWNANGIVQVGSTWCYAKGGKLETSFSGMAQGGGIWRYVRNGYVDFTYTGMAQNQYGWWYMSNGSVNFGYTGLGENQYGTWVFRNGQIVWGTNGLTELPSGWYYVNNGLVDKNFKGMAENQYGWWYIKNGKPDLSYTGLAQNLYGWWYMTNGTVNFGYNGIATNEYGTWYVENGYITLQYNGTVTVNGVTYTVKNSAATRV